MRLIALLMCSLLIAGCAAPASVPEAPPAADAVPDALVLDPPMWSRDGLEAQPRMEAFVRRIPPELGYRPGTTPWQPSELELPTPAEARTPGLLLLEIARALPGTEWLGQELWEQTLRIHQDEPDRAEGVILQWGMMDDAIQGHDLRVRMREEGGAWRVERVEERYHCARRVTEDGRCA